MTINEKSAAEQSRVEQFYERWLCPEGRMGRKLYFLNSLGAWAACGVVVAGTFLFGVATVLTYAVVWKGVPEEHMELLVAVICLFIMVASIPFYFFCTVALRACIRRWHDIGRGDTSYVVVAGFVPVALIVLICILGFVAWMGARNEMVDALLLEEGIDALDLRYIVYVLIGVFFLYDFVLSLYLLVAKGEAGDNAYGAAEGAYRLVPEIRTRPRERLPLKRVIFRLHGRIHRKPYILGMLCISILCETVTFVAIFAGPFFSVRPATYTMIPIVLQTALETGVCMQRLRDVGWSSFVWLIPTGVAVASMLAIAILAPPATDALYDMESKAAIYTLIGSSICVGLYFLYVIVLQLWLICAPGETGTNKYGENPLVEVRTAPR